MDYDFQALYSRIQALVPMIGDGSVVDSETLREIDKIERELSQIHREISGLEREFPPSLLRRFFDHLKNQDEKILFALVKFYLFEVAPNQDTYDKLDILLTRLAEVPGESDISRVRDPEELRASFVHLAELAGLEPTEPEESRALVAIFRDTREEILQVHDFRSLIESGIVDRFRELKGRLGRDGLNPDVLIEIVTTNIVLKNSFRQLYQQEEVRILEDTNRIFEIERYLERNPGIAHEELRRQLEVFRATRKKFDLGRKDNNIRRKDVLSLRTSMESVIKAFEPGAKRQASPERGTDPFFVVPAEANSPDTDVAGESAIISASTAADDPAPREAEDGRNENNGLQEVSEGLNDASEVFSKAVVEEEYLVDEDDDGEVITVDAEESPAMEKPAPVHTVEELGDALDPEGERPGILEILPQDPLLTTALHKIVFALELVVWDYPLEQAAGAKELHHMRLEPWEVGAYRVLMEGKLEVGTLPWQLQAFLLTSTALRVKMDEEYSEIQRIRMTQNRGRLMDLLDLAAQSLERARDVDRRFRWFIDDMLFQGDTEKLEQVHRSHFRFLHSYSALWLEHQGAGGITPL